MSTSQNDFQYGDWDEEPEVLVYQGEVLPRPMTLQEVLDRPN
jgi:hypothetical protein